MRHVVSELHAMTKHAQEMQGKTGAMSFPTMSAIAKALHPEGNATEADRDDAFKLFTAWKADKDKARRRAQS